MKKILLEENEIQALDNLSSSGANGYEVMKRIFKSQLADLTSVMNIDPKGNVGLQTCARQLAYEMLADVAEVIFPDEAKNIQLARKGGGAAETGDKKISQWR